MSCRLHVLLMFDGQAEEAMRFYLSLFDDGSLDAVTYYGEQDTGVRGLVKHARFTAGGQVLRAADAPTGHLHEFSPASTLVVSCRDPEEFDRLFGELSRGGRVLRPPSASADGERQAWFTDRYHVAWQLHIES